VSEGFVEGKGGGVEDGVSDEPTVTEGYLIFCVKMSQWKECLSRGHLKRVRIFLVMVARVGGLLEMYRLCQTDLS
jgi:hypothetical protein